MLRHVRLCVSMCMYRSGWTSNIGGCSSASSIAVMPTDQISHSSLYPPLISTAATSGAILRKGREQQQQKVSLTSQMSRDKSMHVFGLKVKKCRNKQRNSSHNCRAQMSTYYLLQYIYCFKQ